MVGCVKPIIAPGLDLRLVNLPGYSPDFNADEAIWGWAREGGDGQSLPGQQGGSAGAGREFPGRVDQQERRGEAPLPDGPAIKGRNTPARLATRFPSPGKCTSHLGFGLGIFDADFHPGPAGCRSGGGADHPSTPKATDSSPLTNVAPASARQFREWYKLTPSVPAKREATLELLIRSWEDINDGDIE